MKKFLLVTISALTIISTAFADQSATLTCTGENIILAVKSPYMGEDSKTSQQLYVLKTKDTLDETSYTAYFLNISYDIGKGGTIYISGKNEVGGTFNLVTDYPEDVSDGTTIRRVSQGTLAYDHGPLKGEESVKCVTE